MPEANKNKTKPKAKLYFGNADELAKTNNYVTPEYLQEVDKRRKDWNEFVEFLKKENVAGSANLDKSGAGLGYLKKWNKLNPDKAFTQEDIKDVQYYSRNTKKETGERVNDGILGKVTSTFTFPDSRVNTYEMKNGQKVLVKSEDPNIGNYQYQADKINFGIAAKNKADVSKLPIYNKNSANTDISWDKNDATANNLLKEQTKKRSLSGQSLSNPNKFVKPLTATEYHPAVQEQLEGSYFDNNQKVVDYNQNLQQQKQAEVQQQADTRTALQKKLATSKSKDFTKEEALDYFNETGKILPQNKVQGKYNKNKQNQIIGINDKPLYETESYRTLKDLGYNIKEGIKSSYRNAEWDMGSRAVASGIFGAMPAMIAPIPTLAAVGAWMAQPAVTGLGDGIAKTLKKKTKRIKNEEFGMPTFQDDNSDLTQKREGGLISKYDNGGKTKRPVFPGKLDNRVVSDNTSVQRPTIQKQDVRLKTPQEVKKANRENFQKRIGVKPTYNVQELTDFGTPEPGIEYVPVEAALLPGTPAIKGLGTAGNFALDMVNPLSGVRSLKIKPKELLGSGNVDKISKLNFSTKLNETKDQLSKAVKGTSNVLSELKGELLQGKANRESIKQGNEWLENWIKHPTTQSKIDADIDNKKYFATSFLKNPNQDEELFELIRTQSKNFKPNSKEYPLLKQLDTNLQQYLSKESKTPIHQGNWGVSYQHSYFPQERLNIEMGIENPLSDRYGSWISRTTKLPQSKRVSTTIHEGTHDWVSAEAFKKSGMKNTALYNMNPKIKDDFLEWEFYHNHGIDPVTQMGEERAYQAYLADPTEQHARIMELRHELGITPDYKMDLEDSKKILDWVDKGGSRIDPKFLNVIDKDPKKLAELFNKFWMVPPAAIGAGALQQNQEQPQYPTGGKVKPIVVNNPNDPRLRAYNDSAQDYRYNPSSRVKELERLNYDYKLEQKSGDWAIELNHKPVQPYIYQGPAVKPKSSQTTPSQNNSYNQKYPPIYVTDKNDPRIGSYAEAGNQYLFKEIPKPVIKKQTAVAEQIKPLYQAPQLTMPERLELPSVSKKQKVFNKKDFGKYYGNHQSGINNYYYLNHKTDEIFTPEEFNKLIGKNLNQNSYEEGGKVNTLEGDLISKVIMNRNRDKNFVNRAYAVGQNPSMFSVQDPENFGDVMSHKMAWGTDDAGQAYMYPTIMNPNNEAIRVPNQYADYISSEGYKNATGMEYAYGGTINNMKKRTLKKYQYSYGGLTVTDLNKYDGGGINLGNSAKIKPYDFSKLSSGLGGSSTTGAATTGATVSGNAIGAGIGFGAEMIGGLMPDKTYEDSEGNDLGSRKSVGESALEYGAKGAAITAMLGGADFGIATALGTGYGAYKGLMEKEEMERKQKEAEARITNKNINRIANTSYNWGTPNINTSTNMMFPNGGMVLNYDDPNANAELELQETFQMPDGTVGNVDGPSHEMGGIAVDLPEGTRIWSDKLKHNGKTFAKHTKPITNKIARLEKEIAKSPNNSEAKENSIALLNQQLDYYFDTQETNKQNTEMKRTLREGGMIKRADGSYSKPGLWDNIRANKGSGKKPTAEMLKQERKIRANEKAMGGYMYAEGGINNPGFRALPEEVQENILANMGMGGEMYSLGGRLMNTPMYAEGGKLPEGVLKSRLEAHMSPEEADEYLSEYGKGGYTVRRSSDRKGKTHVVIGPDGTKKYFGDPNLGERGKSKYGKEAFYARHKKNLAGNPYFRAYARATWEDGGMMGEEYAQGGIHIKPENKGKFTAYAKSHGKGVQEMAAHIMANKEDYSPTIVKRANFAKNAAGWKHEMGGYLPMYQDGDMVDNPDRVAIGAINPKTGQPYTMQEVASYTDTQGMLPTPFGKQYGGLDNTGKQLYGNYEQTVLPVGYNPKVNYAQNSLTPNNIPLKDRVKFTPPAMDSDFDMNQIPEELMYNTPQVPNPYANKPFNQLPIGITRPNTKLNIGEFGANANRYVSPENLTMENIGTATPGKTGQGFFNKAGQFIQNNPGLVGQLGTAALTAGIQSARVNRLARPKTLADVRLRENVANPNLVDYSAERNAIDRTALNAMADAQRGFGSSAAAQAFKNKARLNQLEGTGRSFQGQENANAQIRNQFLAARQEAAMREAMMNNEIDKYNLENVYGYDTMTTAQKNAITAMLGNTAGQAFGKQSDYANQLQQANILANQYDPSVLNDMIKNGKLKVVDGQIVKARNGGMIQYAEGGEVNPYKRSLNKVVNFNTSKAAETMDAEYAAAMAANQDKYTSSVTGLDYKVIKTLPKNEKRALVMDMWRDTHGEAPTQKQIESGVKAIEGKKVSSAKAKEVANVANSQESMQDMISKKWPTGTYIPTAPEPEGPSMMERGEQFYEEQIVPAARTLKKNFKEGVEKGYNDLKDVYGKAKTMGKQAYANLENAEYPDVAAGSRMDTKIKGKDGVSSLPLPLTMLSRDLFSKVKDRTITEDDLTKGELETLKMTINGVKKATGRDYLKYADYDNKKGSKMSSLDLIREIVNNYDNQKLKFSFGQGNFRQEGDSTIFEDTYNFNDRNNESYLDNVSNRLAKGDNILYAPFRALGTTYGSPEGQGNKVRVAMYNPKGKRSLKK